MPKGVSDEAFDAKIQMVKEGIEVAQAALQEAAKKYDEIYASIGPTTVRMRETLQQLSSAINACKEHGGGSAGKQCCKNLEMAMQASKLARLNAEVAKADLTTSRQIVADKTKELNAIVQRLDKVIADRAAMVCVNAVDAISSSCRVSLVEPSSATSRECPSTPPPAKKQRMSEVAVDYRKKACDLDAMEVDV
ncbi:hypothetical protein AAVH_05847 [Aphelenchoides avenae]|nr:hypothetical protein AAVH_05847 [Aphelenchus avenae]